MGKSRPWAIDYQHDRTRRMAEHLMNLCPICGKPTKVGDIVAVFDDLTVAHDECTDKALVAQEVEAGS